MAARVALREITPQEGNRVLRIVRRGTGSVVTWRRAQIKLLSAQGMSPPRISEVVFTDPDTVREVIHYFNRDGYEALYPRYRGGRPPTLTLPKRQEIKRIVGVLLARHGRREVPSAGDQAQGPDGARPGRNRYGSREKREPIRFAGCRAFSTTVPAASAATLAPRAGPILGRDGVGDHAAVSMR